MKLPKTERELRLGATRATEAFLTELVSSGVDVSKARIPIYSLYDVKAACVWVARQAIREYCPHLADEGDRDLSDEIPEEEDRPL